MAAYQASTTNYEDSQKLHEAKREANATRAVSKYLFGLSTGEDGSSTLASGSAAASVGFMLLQPMQLADYATKFTSALRAYKTALMSTPCVCRQSAVEADVATVVLCDFAQMGSLKQEVLVAAKAVMTNVDAACMIVCYPEIASGYTQCVLAPREKAVAASAGDPQEDDPSSTIDDEEMLPAEGAPPAMKTKKAHRRLLYQLAWGRHAVHRELALGIGNYYPLDFANKFSETDPRVRASKTGFVMLPLETSSDMTTSKLLKGGLDNLAFPSDYIKVSFDRGARVGLGRNLRGSLRELFGVRREKLLRMCGVLPFCKDNFSVSPTQVWRSEACRK